jgi:WD domain, G-beta repeat
MHIYLSVFPFVPSQSKIRHLYGPPISDVTQCIAVASGLANHWDPISVTLSEGGRPVILSPCGTMVATCSTHVRLFNAKSGQLLRSLGSKMKELDRVSVVFSPDSRYIAATTSLGMECWEAATGVSLGTCPFPSSFNFFPSDLGEMYKLLFEGGEYIAWNPNRMHATSLVFTPDGLSIAAGTEDGKLLFWNIADPEGALLQSPESSSHACECRWEGVSVDCEAHRIKALHALPGSSTLLGVTEGAVVFWDRSTHKILNTIPRVHEDARWQLYRRKISPPISISTDKKLLTIDCDPFVIGIYSAYTQSRLYLLSGHWGAVTTTAFAPQNRLCSASEDRTVRIWDVANANQLKCIRVDCVLTHSVFSIKLGTFILSPGWGTQDRMVRLAADECVHFGPRHFGGSPQIALDGDVIASYGIHTIMIARVQDLIQAGLPTDGSGNLYERARFGYQPSGNLVVLREVAELEIPLKVLQGTKSVEVVIRSQTFANVSHDFSRVATIDNTGDPSLSIYDVCSGRHVASLPLPPLDRKYLPESLMRFSWDSCTMYLRGADGELYAVTLPPISMTQGRPLSQLRFQTVGWVLTRDFDCLCAGGLPNGLTHFPPLQFEEMGRIAYSPNGGLVAILPRTATVDRTEGMIQILRSPDHNLIATLREHPHFPWQIQFLDHQPHILVVWSHIGFTCWDAVAGQRLGQCIFKSEGIYSVHAYNASDYLCLKRSGYPAESLELLAVQLQGPDLPAQVQQLCIFPAHLSVAKKLSVHPLHPHIVALHTRNGIIEIDISNCCLPFTF